MKTYKHSSLLNRVSDMQRAPYYATACQTLVQVEMAIVALEDENKALSDALWQALDDMGDEGYCVCPAAKEMMKSVMKGTE